MARVSVFGQQAIPAHNGFTKKPDGPGVLMPLQSLADINSINFVAPRSSPGQMSAVREMLRVV